MEKPRPPSTITTLTTRRPKWKYAQPPPTPRILHLPRRTPRRKIALPAPPGQGKTKVDRRGKLESLFDQEREFARGGAPPPILMARDEAGGVEKRRERVGERESAVAVAAVEEEKWRVQAEMLRAECGMLRMEKEIALKKAERRKVRMQRTLQSAVHTLLSGRERISNGENGTAELEEEIVQLAEKLEKLQGRSSSSISSTRSKERSSNGTIIIKSSNFDRIQQMAEASLSTSSAAAAGNLSSQANCNVVQIEILRRKMEGLSRGNLLERMEDEYGSMLSTTANSSAASSASNSRRIELPDMSMATVRHPYKEKKKNREELQQACTGSCKAIVRRVIEQVRAETEQWSQMQAMLGQVRDEMEGLQASRAFWEDRALEADSKLQSLHSSEQEWRQKASSFEQRAKELEAQVSKLQKEIDQRIKKERDDRSSGRRRNIPAATPNEMEKQVLVCRMKENDRHEHEHEHERPQQFRLKDVLREERRKSIGASLKRSPFRDIGNRAPTPLPKHPLWL